jgi:hypothetical protein
VLLCTVDVPVGGAHFFRTRWRVGFVRVGWSGSIWRCDQCTAPSGRLSSTVPTPRTSPTPPPFLRCMKRPGSAASDHGAMWPSISKKVEHQPLNAKAEIIAGSISFVLDATVQRSCAVVGFFALPHPTGNSQRWWEPTASAHSGFHLSHQQLSSL